MNVDPNLAPALASLQQQAIRQSQLVGPVSAPALRKVVKKLSTKAPGLDGLTSSMLKKASDAQLQELSEQIADWEQQGSMPGAVLTTAVAMLPKKPDRERPIGLTSFGYRLWARARWGLYEKWAAEYAHSAPWDGARKGMSSLDIALSRLVRGEAQHYNRRHRTTRSLHSFCIFALPCTPTPDIFVQKKRLWLLWRQQEESSPAALSLQDSRSW